VRVADRSTRAQRTLPAGIVDETVIGRGGFATVYLGWQPDFHRKVAVKVLDADGRDPVVRARFEREVRAMGAVSDHPHVVPVYDAGVQDDRPYLVMPYLSGGSLADEITRGPLDPAEVVRVGRAVADALEAAHRTGLLHRDVKPSNILRDGYGEPKLGDFGVARFSDATTTQGHIAMTLAYAAPEVLDGKPATVASDVYSLGATLHALLRGASPFTVAEGALPVAMAMRVMAEDPPDLREAGVPAGLAAVVDKAMAKDPDQRYPSAAALRDALVAADLTDTDADVTMAMAPPTATMPAPIVAPVPTPPVAPPPRPAPQRRPDPRRRLLLGTLLVLGLALVALLVGVAMVEEDGDGDGDQAADAPTTTVAPPADADPTTTTTAAEATTTTAPAPAAVDGSPVDAAREYFALLDAGDVDAAWNRLSPAYQRASGESSYRGFWSTIDSVEVLNAQPVGDDSAALTLRYTRTDGSTATERNTLRFVEGEDGELLIDGSA
jgi:serine/threonine-protein kinase PknK